LLREVMLAQYQPS